MYIGIDLGTSSVKMILTDSNQKILLLPIQIFQFEVLKTVIMSKIQMNGLVLLWNVLKLLNQNLLNFLKQFQ